MENMRRMAAGVMEMPPFLFTFLKAQKNGLLSETESVGMKISCSDKQPTPPTTKSSLITRCAVCNEPAPMSCGSCKAINYCTKECQKSDWPLHKIVCTEYIKFTSSNPRPADTSEAIYKLALLFPVSSIQPIFQWIDIKKSPHAPKRSFCVPNMSYLGNDTDILLPEITCLTQRVLKDKDWKHFQLHHHVHLHCRENYTFDGSKDNKSIWNILKRFYKNEWKGPFFFMGGRCVRCGIYWDPYEFFDFELADLRQAIQYFKTAGPLKKRWDQMSDIEKATCLTSNCAAEMQQTDV